MLAWTIYISYLGVLVLMLLPKDNPSAARKVALLAAVAGFVVALAGFVRFEAGATVPVADLAWVPSLGIRFHLAADGISLTLVLLTGLAAVAGGISEALVTTAVGLFVAVPAVWVYNYFIGKVESFDVEMDNSSSELIDYFIKRTSLRGKK